MLFFPSWNPGASSTADKLGLTFKPKLPAIRGYLQVAEKAPRNKLNR